MESQRITEVSPNFFDVVGFSEKLFDLMKMAETDREVLLNEIRQVELAA